jgi:hypothetical protein
MSNFKEDTNHNFRTIFFLILFSLLVFITSNNQGKHFSSFTNYPIQTSLVFGDISSHHNSIICNPIKLSEIQKYYEWALNITCLSPISIHYIISDYNHRIAQNLIQFRKNRLTIEPLLLWRLNNTLSVSDTGDLPSLS